MVATEKMADAHSISCAHVSDWRSFREFRCTQFSLSDWSSFCFRKLRLHPARISHSKRCSLQLWMFVFVAKCAQGSLHLNRSRALTQLGQQAEAAQDMGCSLPSDQNSRHILKLAISAASTKGMGPELHGRRTQDTLVPRLT